MIASHDDDFVRACAQRVVTLEADGFSRVERGRCRSEALRDCLAESIDRISLPDGHRDQDPNRRALRRTRHARKIRHRNKLYYRFNHWPIWIFVFFIAPGPLMFDMFERGFDVRMATWLGVVLVGTAIAGLRGRLPGLRAPALHHPLHRRPTQSALSANLLHDGLGRSCRLCRAEHRRPGLRCCGGRMAAEADVRRGYFPIAGTIWRLGACGWLPRVKRSTKGEGHERRYFYGSVWAVAMRSRSSG